MLAFEMIGWRHYWSRILRITTIRSGEVYDTISNSEISREVFLICRKYMSLLWDQMSLWIPIICRKISVIRRDCHQSVSSLNEIFSKIELWKLYIGLLIRDPDSKLWSNIWRKQYSSSAYCDLMTMMKWFSSVSSVIRSSKSRATRSRENLHIRTRLELNSRKSILDPSNDRQDKNWYIDFLQDRFLTKYTLSSSQLLNLKGWRIANLLSWWKKLYGVLK